MKGFAVSTFAAILFAGSAGAAENPPAAGGGFRMPDFASIEITATEIAPRMHVLRGAGGNITLFAAPSGPVLVDSDWREMTDKVNAAVMRIAGRPARYVIATHYHVDHSGGLLGVARAGAVSIGPENLRRRLTTGGTNDAGILSPAVPEPGLPSLIYRDMLTLHVDGEQIELHHPAAAHTDTDTIVYFRNANVLATGDIFGINRYPGLDMNNGGNMIGSLQAIETMIGLANDRTIVVPGHGMALGRRADLIAVRDAVQAVRTRVADMIARGMTEDAVIAAKPSAQYDATFSPQGPGDNFVRALYRSLTRGPAAEGAGQ